MPNMNLRHPVVQLFGDPGALLVDHRLDLRLVQPSMKRLQRGDHRLLLFIESRIGDGHRDLIGEGREEALVPLMIAI